MAKTLAGNITKIPEKLLQYLVGYSDKWHVWFLFQGHKVKRNAQYNTVDTVYSKTPHPKSDEQNRIAQSVSDTQS